MERQTTDLPVRDVMSMLATRLGKAGTGSSATETLDELKRVIDELHVHQVKLEHENQLLQEVQQKLERSCDTFGEWFDTVPVGCMDLDSKGVIRQINPAAASFLGASRTDLIGKRLLSFINPKDISRLVHHLKHALQGGRRTTEFRLRPKGPGSIVVQAWSVAVQEPQRRTVLCRTTLTDISERKRIEEALHESNECFRVMIDSAPVLLWMSGVDQGFTYFNRAWLEFTGRTLKQELGRGWMESVHPSDLQRALDYYESAFKEREAVSYEFRLRRADGQFRWFLNTGTPRFSPQGAFAGYIGSSIDITERKEAEEMRRQVLEDLEVLVQERTANLKSANRQLREEISSRKKLEKQIIEISDREQRRIGRDLHDGLGQQLTGVSFLCKVLAERLARKSKVSAEARQAAEIHRLVSTALTQTRELAHGLHVVELDASGLRPALDELRNHVENLYGVKCQLKYETSLRIHDPAVAMHLLRITQEAVNNAVKHATPKCVSISLGTEDNRIVLRVKDDGIGCPAVLPERKGMGLHTMKYRTEMIQGVFDIRRGGSTGTVVTCSFPTKANKKSARSDDNESQHHHSEKS